MQVHNIHLDDNGLPDTINATLTLDEAILITKYTGTLVPSTPVSSGIYGELAGGVFNRYWEDGVNGAERGEWS